MRQSHLKKCVYCRLPAVSTIDLGHCRPRRSGGRIGNDWWTGHHVGSGGDIGGAASLIDAPQTHRTARLAGRAERGRLVWPECVEGDGAVGAVAAELHGGTGPRVGSARGVSHRA